jgi:DNA-binding GntR family transcriptional regulator
MNRGKLKNGALEDMSHKAFNEIRRMLYHKELVPGQKIVYRELKEKLSMSPTPIIQALKWLEIQGFAYHTPNRGYYIAPCTLEELEELFDIRQLLEPSLVPAAVENLDEDGLKDLESSLEAYRSVENNIYLKERLFRNKEFHLTLASLSKKRNQIRILENIFDLLFLKYGGNYLPIPSLKSVNREHKKIFECVAARKPKEARKLLSKHTANVREQVITSYRQLLEEKERTAF